MLDTEKTRITFEAARRLAQEGCDALSEEFVEAEFCWIFFSCNRGDWATAVSKFGEVRSVYDLRDEPEKMQAYLAMLSAYCSGDKVISDRLLCEFMRKHYSDKA